MFQKNLLKKLSVAALAACVAASMNVSVFASSVTSVDDNSTESELVEADGTEVEEETLSFTELPSEFSLSGFGAWETSLSLNEDGTFAGSFTDSEDGDIGDGYPNGTVTEGNFSGKFSTPVKVSDYIYSMELIEFEEEPAGEEKIENGIRYITGNVRGYELNSEFLIYLPGCPTAEMDEGFLYNTLIYTEKTEYLPEDTYGLHNPSTQVSFLGLVEEETIIEGNIMPDGRYVTLFTNVSVPGYGSIEELKIEKQSIIVKASWTGLNGSDDLTLDTWTMICDEYTDYVGYSQEEMFDSIQSFFDDQVDIGLDVTIANGKVASISIHN